MDTTGEEMQEHLQTVLEALDQDPEGTSPPRVPLVTRPHTYLHALRVHESGKGKCVLCFRKHSDCEWSVCTPCKRLLQPDVMGKCVYNDRATNCYHLWAAAIIGAPYEMAHVTAKNKSFSSSWEIPCFICLKSQIRLKECQQASFPRDLSCSSQARQVKSIVFIFDKSFSLLEIAVKLTISD